MQTLQTRLPGYADVPDYTILRLYVAVRKKQSRNSFAWGLNDPPPPRSYRLHTQPTWRSPQKLYLVQAGYILQ